MIVKYRHVIMPTGTVFVQDGVTKTVLSTDLYVDLIISEYDQFFSKVLQYYNINLLKVPQRYNVSIRDSFKKFKYLFVFDYKNTQDLNSPIQLNNESISIYRSQFNVYEDYLNFAGKTELWEDLQLFLSNLKE